MVAARSVGIPGGDQRAGTSEDLGQRALVKGHDRETRRHGLDHGHTEPFVGRR